MKTLILCRGLPGGGKTTFAKFICFNTVAADDYFTDSNGNYNFNAAKLGAAHRYSENRTEELMRSGIEEIAVHNTFTTEKEMNPYFDLAAAYGYRVFSIIVENRHSNGSVHDVPVETMDKMEKRFNVKVR